MSMSLEPVRRDTSSSPLSSGRSTPVPRKRNDDGIRFLAINMLQHEWKIEKLTILHRLGDIARKDPKYKRYATNIEKALVLFEMHALQEWADYISFLGRLLKVNPSSVARGKS